MEKLGVVRLFKEYYSAVKKEQRIGSSTDGSVCEVGVGEATEKG